MRSDDELRKIQRYFKSGAGQYGAGDTFMGVRMGHVFALAKEFVLMEPAQIELLLESPLHEMRAGAVSIMAKQAVLKKTSGARRRELFDLYLRRHDRINNWDLVDLGARDVLGRFLLDKKRDALYSLARSENLWERRSAMWACMAFLQRGERDDMYAIAGILLHDREDLIHKVVGGMLREAGKKDKPQLLAFLDKHATMMPPHAATILKDGEADPGPMSDWPRISQGAAGPRRPSRNLAFSPHLRY